MQTDLFTGDFFNVYIDQDFSEFHHNKAFCQLLSSWSVQVSISNKNSMQTNYNSGT